MNRLAIASLLSLGVAGCGRARSEANVYSTASRYSAGQTSTPASSPDVIAKSGATPADASAQRYRAAVGSTSDASSTGSGDHRSVPPASASRCTAGGASPPTSAFSTRVGRSPRKLRR